MSVPERPERPDHHRISDADRQAVAEILRDAAGDGRLELDELEERLEATWAAKTYGELVPITEDLPADAPTAPVRRPPAAPPARDGEATAERFFAVMSGVERKGVWTVPEAMSLTCVMGGANLDLRQARFAGAEAVITISAVMGGANILVPPDVDVVMEGIGIMGGFSGPDGADLPADARVLRVKGFAFWGGVNVERRPRDDEDGARKRLHGGH